MAFIVIMFQIVYTYRMSLIEAPVGVDNQNPALIVLIEDNPADVNLFRWALDEQGEVYELQVLRDGEEALRFIREQSAGVSDPAPCVIVLDLHLPRYDGLAVLKAIRQDPQLGHVKVAVVAASASPKEELESRRMGVQLYREKPTTLDQSLALAKEILILCKDGSLETIP